MRLQGDEKRMKKIVPLMIVLALLIAGAPSYAAGAGGISFDAAKSIMLENSRQLQKQDALVKEFDLHYNNALKSTKDIFYEGVYFSVGGVTGMRPYPIDTQITLAKNRYFLSAQMKYYWLSAIDGKTVMTNGLTTGLRDLYTMLFSADDNVKVMKQKYDIAREVNAQNKARLQQGLITQLDMKQSQYNLDKAENDLNAAKRSRENAVRSFNAFLGVPVGATYTNIEEPNEDPIVRIDTAENYISSALEKRMEIIDLKRQIDLKRLEASVLQMFIMNAYPAHIREDYNNALTEVKNLNLKLEIKKLAVQKEIKDAYVDVLNTYKSVKTMQGTLETQKKALANTEMRYKLGYITKDVLEQNRAAVNALENGYKAALYSYNTKVIKLNNASGIGPAYK